MNDRPPLGMDLVRMSAKIFVGTLVTLVSLFVVFAVLGGIGAGGAAELAKQEATLLGKASSKNRLLQIKVEGPILTFEPESTGFFGLPGGVAYGYKIKEELENAAEVDAIKGVLLHVSTPGGSIVGSEAIADGIRTVKEAGKPVYVYVNSISASGGVWSTAPADAIYADEGSIIGSVGVIFSGLLEYDEPIAFTGLFSGVETRGGIVNNTISSGIGKDLGNPFRPMTDRERALLQQMSDEFYAKFVDHVVENREIDRNRLINEYGAAIFANDAAEARGYIDGTKTWQETVDALAEAAELGDDWRLVAPEEEAPEGLAALLGATFGKTGPQAKAEAEFAARQAACQTLTMEVAAISLPHLTAICR